MYCRGTLAETVIVNICCALVGKLCGQTVMKVWYSRSWYVHTALLFYAAPSLSFFASTPQGDSKTCRLSWLTNSALVYEPNCGGMGGWVRGVAGSQPMSFRFNSIFTYGALGFFGIFWYRYRVRFFTILPSKVADSADRYFLWKTGRNCSADCSSRWRRIRVRGICAAACALHLGEGRGKSCQDSAW